MNQNSASAPCPANAVQSRTTHFPAANLRVLRAATCLGSQFSWHHWMISVWLMRASFKYPKNGCYAGLHHVGLAAKHQVFRVPADGPLRNIRQNHTDHFKSECIRYSCGVLKERSILQVFEYLCEDFGNMDSAESAPFMVICIIHGVICFPRRWKGSRL